MSVFTAETIAQLEETFVPMIWGTALPDNWDFLQKGSAVMGFNEPDQYGPACCGFESYGCSATEYRAATCSGWQPLFDPNSAVGYWQTAVNAMAAQINNGQRIVSPSMAQGAEGDGNLCIGVDPAQNGAIKNCPGWLATFKNLALQQECTSLDGTVDNCWDVIDVIQIHAYARDASDVTTKIQGYYDTFTDDFEGTGGRSKKSLWLTEVAYGGNEAAPMQSFVADLMNPETGLTNREAFSYVERVSWFSDWSFDAFNLTNYAPAPYEAWSSALFDPISGSLTPAGESFFSYCS